MKKKIVFGLSLVALMFFLGGIYIMTTMEKTIYALHSLSQQHHPVALRINLLRRIEKNQEAIKLRQTKYAVSAAAADQGSMSKAANNCLVCHPSSSRAAQTINRLKNRIETYQELTRVALDPLRVSTITDRQVNAALQAGDDVIKEMEGIIAVTSVTLDNREREIFGEIKQRKTTLILLLTIGPFFALGVALLLMNGITQPVQSLLDATRRLKAGDLEHRVPLLQDEFGEVADSFNEMVTSLKNQMLALQRTEQLRVSGEMAAGLAHEIRNPLAGIKAAIELLLEDLELAKRDREVLEKIIEQIQHIEQLMRNLLNFARPVAAQLSTVNINTILEQTVFFMEKHPSFSTGDNRKQIIKELDSDLPDTLADPQQLQQVFLNLFLNAGDATPKSGTITMRTQYDKSANTIVIELRDTGKGIPDEMTERIFQPFVTTKRKGTGLGLAVSRRLVEEQGGSIAALNNPDGGATFRITLPVTPVKNEGKGAIP